MKSKEMLSEALLEGWLHMTSTIWNERLVTAMTYNESLVCNILYKYRNIPEKAVTATELCRKLRIHKPQMNVILNKLEKAGIVERIRSSKDKRSVYIFLTEKGIPLYEKAHREILRLPEAMIERLGAEKAEKFAETMQEVAECFDGMIGQRGKNSQECCE